MPIAGGVGVHLEPHDDGPRARMSGLQSCGSIWACPVCSAAIRFVRSLDVAEVIARHEAAGGAVLFSTLTLRHHVGEPLSGLLAGLQEAQRLTWNGAPWKRQAERLGMVGRVRAAEVTVGPNGWHPHTHALLLVDGEVSEDRARAFGEWLSERWVSMVARQGLQLPDHAHGSVVELVRTPGAAADYLTKLQEGAALGLEVTRGDLKGSANSTPFEVLDRASRGSPAAVTLWREYEQATRGRRAVEWSRGLRERYGMGQARDDAEIAADERSLDAGNCIAALDRGEWRAIARRGLDAALLEAAERDGIRGVFDLVAHALALETADSLR